MDAGIMDDWQISCGNHYDRNINAVLEKSSAYFTNQIDVGRTAAWLEVADDAEFEIEMHEGKWFGCRPIQGGLVFYSSTNAVIKISR